MMGWFISAVVLIVVGVLLLLTRRRITNPAGRSGVRIVAGLFVVVGVVILGLNCYTQVPARNVGVVNSLGKAESALDNGIHLVKPWSSIETVDATTKTVNLGREQCVTVRLSNQTTACIEVTYAWNIDQHGNANEIWQAYRGTNDDVVGNVGTNVVAPAMRTALGVAFETYNPLEVLASGRASETSSEDLSQAALAKLRASVIDGVTISKLTIPNGGIHYDDTTQGKLNGFAQALADTQIATQQKLTAEQQKQANDLLAAASSNDPGVKYQNCLNLIKDLAAKGQLQNLPATFNCGESGGTPVIIGQR